MFLQEMNLTTAIHTRLGGSLADQWLNAASQVNLEHLAEELLLVDDKYRAQLFSELNADTRLNVLPYLPAAEATQLIEGLSLTARVGLLKRLPFAELVRLIGRLSFRSRITALSYVSNSKQKRLWLQRKIQHKPFHFDNAVSQLNIATTMEAAIDYFFSAEHKNYYIYVTDDNDVLCGVLYGYVLSGITVKSAPIALYMDKPSDLILPDHDQEHVAHCLSKYKVLELPVVNEHKKLIGVVDLDDISSP